MTVRIIPRTWVDQAGVMQKRFVVEDTVTGKHCECQNEFEAKHVQRRWQAEKLLLPPRRGR